MNSLKKDLTNKTVLVAPEWLEEGLTEDQRTFHCTGGFGCSPFTQGGMISGYWADTKEPASIRGEWVEKEVQKHQGGADRE